MSRTFRDSTSSKSKAAAVGFEVAYESVSLGVRFYFMLRLAQSARARAAAKSRPKKTKVDDQKKDTVITSQKVQMNSLDLRPDINPCFLASLHSHESITPSVCAYLAKK